MASSFSGPGRGLVFALGPTVLVTLSCGPDLPSDATDGDATGDTSTEATTTLVPTGGSGTDGPGTESGSSGGVPAFDPCVAGEVLTMAESRDFVSLDLFADTHGWQLALQPRASAHATPAGMRFVRPGADPVFLDAVDQDFVAVLRTAKGVLVCWDDGTTSKVRDHGFCMTTDEQLQPVSDVVHVAYRRARRFVEFPDVRYALAENGTWPIDGNGVPVGEPLMFDASPLAFGADWMLGARFVDPACPNPEESALCTVEFAPFDPHGHQLAPFLPLSDTKLSPNDRLYAAISGDNYLVAWTKGGPWELRVVTRESELVRAETLELGIAAVFAVPQGFVFAVLLGENPGEQVLGLLPFDVTGATLSPPVVLGEIAAETHLHAVQIAPSASGLAAAWVTGTGLFDEEREMAFFRALGCDWPPTP